jgi:hypothetical protein
VEEACVAETDGTDLAVGEGDTVEEEIAALEGGESAVGEIEFGEGGVFECGAFENGFCGGVVGVLGCGYLAWLFAVAVCFFGSFGHGCRLPFRACGDIVMGRTG